MELSGDSGVTAVLQIWISIAGTAACAVISAASGLFTPWLLIAAAASAAASIFASQWYPRRYSDSIRGCFDAGSIRAVHGVLWKKEIVVPVSSLRTAEYRQTPLQRRYKSCTVILRFAGGGAAFPLLPQNQGMELIKIAESPRQE